MMLWAESHASTAISYRWAALGVFVRRPGWNEKDAGPGSGLF